MVPRETRTRHSERRHRVEVSEEDFCQVRKAEIAPSLLSRYRRREGDESLCSRGLSGGDHLLLLACEPAL